MIWKKTNGNYMVKKEVEYMIVGIGHETVSYGSSLGEKVMIIIEVGAFRSCPLMSSFCACEFDSSDVLSCFVHPSCPFMLKFSLSYLSFLTENKVWVIMACLWRRTAQDSIRLIVLNLDHDSILGLHIVWAIYTVAFKV